MQLQSGIEHGITLGTPIGLFVKNEDQRPRDYSETDLYPRPSHADWTYLEKYGVKASSGGGRSSARETIGRVAAGAIAEKYLKLVYNVEIVAFVSSVGKVKLPTFVSPPSQVPSDDDDAVEDALSPEFVKLLKTITRAEVDASPTRCPHQETSERMVKVSKVPHYAEHGLSIIPTAHSSCKRSSGFHWWDRYLRDPRCPLWAWRTRL